jgi:hypothetical protein
MARVHEETTSSLAQLKYHLTWVSSHWKNQWIDLLPFANQGQYPSKDEHDIMNWGMEPQANVSG